MDRPRLSRRHFIEVSAGAAAALGMGCTPTKKVLVTEATEPRQGPAGSGRPAPKTMLILGGTGFLGPHVVAAAQAEGYEITLFNRGKTNPHLFPDLEKLRGDRNDDVSALEGRGFEVVVDTSGYFPRQVEKTAKLLAEHARQYLFVSSISVYPNFPVVGMDETADTAPMPEPYSEKMPDHYGALKAGCERAAEDAMPGRVTRVRPGLIVGPLDPTDRFTYWPARVAKGGRVLAPGGPDDPVQFVDARDLAAFMVRTLSERATGVFNVTGPAEPLTIGGLLEACKQVSGSDAELRWADHEFLAAQEVGPWMQMPVWVPPQDPEFRGFSRVSAAKAVSAGLQFRPLADTIADTLKWWESEPAERRANMRAGITSQREAEVLAALEKRSRTG